MSAFTLYFDILLSLSFVCSRYIDNFDDTFFFKVFRKLHFKKKKSEKCLTGIIIIWNYPWRLQDFLSPWRSILEKYFLVGNLISYTVMLISLWFSWVLEWFCWRMFVSLLKLLLDRSSTWKIIKGWSFLVADNALQEKIKKEKATVERRKSQQKENYQKGRAVVTQNYEFPPRKNLVKEAKVISFY